MVEDDAAAAAMNAIAAARPVDSAVAFETEAAEAMTKRSCPQQTRQSKSRLQ